MNNHQQSGDLFAPETVDERLDQLLQAQNSHKHPDARLVHELQSIYQEDATILAQARERLFQHGPETKDITSPVPAPHDRNERSYSMNSLADIFSPGKRPPIQRAYLLVACLVAALLIGSLIAVLALVHQAQTNVAGTPHLIMPQLTPASRTAQQIPIQGDDPWGIALDEKRGFVYVAVPGCDPKPPCSSTFPAKIEQHSLADGHLIRSFDQPKGYSSPFFLAIGPADGHVWFTQPNSDAIGELNPTTGKWMQLKAAKGSTPYDLVFDKNGLLWFTEYNGNGIGFINAEMQKNTKTNKEEMGYVIGEGPTPTANSHPYGITLDSKGNIWFAENGKGISQIGMFTTTGSKMGVIKEFPIDNTLRSQPHLITAAPNGHIWFSESFLGNITEFDPATRATTHYKVAAPCRQPPDNCTHISGIAADKQGNIWFTDSLNATVGYYVPSKKIVWMSQLHDPNSHPHDGLVIQSNGTVWFTEQFGSRVKGDPVQGPVLVMWPGGKSGATSDFTITIAGIAPTPMPTPTPTPTPSRQAVPTPLPTVQPTPIPRR